MRQRFKLVEEELKRPPKAAVPTFLVDVEPWHETFRHNLADLLRNRDERPLRLVTRPGTFWDDVFVPSPLPWRRFGQSVAAHAAVIAALWSTSALWPQATRVVAPVVFHSSDVITYSPPEYLQPINTGGAKARLKQKADPAYAPQAIISVPPEPDNRRQTIVTPPKIKLDHDEPLPNVVAWGAAQPVVPMAAAKTNLKIPELTSTVVAPAPEVNAQTNRNVRSLESAVVAPPPSVETAAIRRMGDINIGHSQVVAPAPHLPVGEQRTANSLAQATLGGSADVVAPPPSVAGGSIAGARGRMIALNVNPAAPAPMEVPNGNRRGTFAATPQGKVGASGTPKLTGGSKMNGAAGSNGANGGVPSGLYVGEGPKPESVTVAGAGRPGGGDGAGSRSSVSRKTASEMSPDKETELERKVFAGRKSYAMTLSVPNLNSGGGSWVMHFAEQKEEKQGALMAPVATRTADPEYPLELMKQNVGGTVMLAAVINADGSVGEVRVLNSIDDRLDEYASSALARWRFLPALKDGNPVALQAVVMIPFRPRAKAGF